MARFSIKKIWAAAIMIAAALVSFASCDGSVDVIQDHTRVAGLGIYDAPKPEDTYVTTLATATDTFVDGHREVTVNVYDIYKTPDEEQKKVLVHSESYSWAPSLRGDDRQIGDYDGKGYTSVAGNVQTSRTPLEDKNHFKRQRVTTTAPYPLVCEDGTPTYPHEFILDDEDVDFVFYSEKKGEDIVVKFGTSKQEWSEKTNRSDETNVPVDGAFWDAEKYLSTAVVKLTPASEYATGEPCSLTAENVTFLLKHKVEPRLLPGGYDAEFYTNQLKLLTRKQTYKFQIAQYDNGKLVGDPVSYEKDYDLFVKFGPLSDKVVDNEADLWAKGGKFAWTNLVSSDAPDGIFTRTSYEQNGTFTLPDNQVIDIVKHWEAGAWGNTKFPYAEIDKITATEDVVKNEIRSTNKQTVSTVKVTFTIYPKAVGDSKKFEPEAIVVEYARIYNIPDNFTTKDEDGKYEFDGKVNSEKNAFNKTVNKYSWTTNTYNNGVLVPNSGVQHAIDMPFEVSVTNGTKVSITKDQRGKAVKVKAVDLGTLSNSDVATEGGNKMRTSTRNATIIMDDGARISAKIVYGHTMKDGKDVFVYTEAKNLRVESVDMPELDEERSGDSEIYLVGLKLAFDCEEHGSVDTRANGDTRTEYLEAQYEQVYGDELLREWGEGTSTPNGNGHDLTAKFYQEWSNSGVKLVNTQTGRMEASFKGRQANDVYADNANFQTASNGKTGSTSGTYSSTASNGQKSQNNVYDYSYNDVKTFTYNGCEVKFTGTVTFAEVSSTIGNGTTSGNNTVYPYTNKAKMVYTVEGKDVTLTDQVSWNIIVAKPSNIPDLVPGTIRSAAITCVPANGDNASNYADGNGTRNAIKCLTIVSDQGAEPVPFAPWNSDVVVPTANEIANGNFVSGSYTTDYNSGYDPKQNGVWVPAVAKDTSKGVGYYVNGDCVRSIRNETLKQWGWRGGNYSVFVTGYTFNVDNDGVLTIRYNNEVVLQCK